MLKYLHYIWRNIQKVHFLCTIDIKSVKKVRTSVTLSFSAESVHASTNFFSKSAKSAQK